MMATSELLGGGCFPSDWEAVGAKKSKMTPLDQKIKMTRRCLARSLMRHVMASETITALFASSGGPP